MSFNYPNFDDSMLGKLTEYDYDIVARMSEGQRKLVANILSIVHKYSCGALVMDGNITDILYLCDCIGSKAVYCLIADMKICNILTRKYLNIVLKDLLLISDEHKLCVMSCIHSLAALDVTLVQQYFSNILSLCSSRTKMRLLKDTADILINELYGASYVNRHMSSILSLGRSGHFQLNTILEICHMYRLGNISGTNIPTYEAITCSATCSGYVLRDAIGIHGRKNILVALRNSSLINSDNIKVLFVNLPSEVMKRSDPFIRKSFVRLGDYIIEMSSNGTLTQIRLRTMINEVCDTLW